MMLRLYGDFNDIEGKDGRWRLCLGSDPESWSGKRIADQLRGGLQVIIDDGNSECEGVLEFESGIWYARIDKGTFRKVKKPRG